tara:strand:- start:184 stop:495 length:312 start_codon:yes stop_codon:yes gene_type:complete
MNRLLVEQDCRQAAHNSRPDLQLHYFPTDSGLADYINHLSRQLVHHLTDALIDLNNISDCLCRRQETHLYLIFGRLDDFGIFTFKRFYVTTSYRLPVKTSIMR